MTLNSQSEETNQQLVASAQEPLVSSLPSSQTHATPATQKRSSPAPEFYRITADHKAWFAAQADSDLVDVIYETEKFLDHHRAKGNSFKDWEAAWRNWMRRAVEYARERNSIRGNRSALQAITPTAVQTLFEDMD